MTDATGLSRRQANHPGWLKERARVERLLWLADCIKDAQYALRYGGPRAQALATELLREIDEWEQERDG